MKLLPIKNKNQLRDIFYSSGIFLLLLGLSIFLFVVVRSEILSNVEQRSQNKILTETQNVEQGIQKSLGEYESILYAARGVFVASEDVTREEWSRYVNSLNLKLNFPAIKSLQFVRKVSNENLEGYISSVRNDISINPSGYPDFTVFPETEGSEHFVVDFIEPFAGNEAAFGFDVDSSDIENAALTIARDTNSVAITQPLNLIQDPDGNKYIIMFLPVYSNGSMPRTLDDRRESLVGFNVALIDSYTLISDVLLQNSVSNITAVSVVDITSGSIELIPLLSSKGEKISLNEDELDSPIQSSRMHFGSRSWQISYWTEGLSDVSYIEEQTPFFVLLAGILISTLVGLILLNFLRLRVRAEKMAEDLTYDLQKFKQAVEAASDTIVISDPEGRVLYANPAVEKITGYSNKEVIGVKAGRPWGNQMSRDFYKEFWNRIKVEKKNFVGEFLNKRKNGENYQALANVSPVLDENENIRFFVAIERDISAEKKLEKAKDEFLSVATHELKAPLTATEVITSMILNGDYGAVSENVKSSISDIHESNKRLLSLVADLLSISRMQMGRMDYNLTHFDVKQTIQNLIPIFSGISKEKGIELKTKTNGSVMIYADQDKFRQVLTNVISNAIKYTEQGSIEISYSVEGDLAKIFVRDSGLGIELKNQQRIFEKFVRLNEDSDELHSTGLGLYISKEYCLKMGGDIEVAESELGKGSVFVVSLPLSGSELALNVQKAIVETEINKEKMDQKDSKDKEVTSSLI